MQMMDLYFTLAASLVSILSGVIADVDWMWEACWDEGCPWRGGGWDTCDPWWCIGPPISIRGLFAIGGTSEGLACDIDDPAEDAALDDKGAECIPGCKLGCRFGCTADIEEGPRSRGPPAVGSPPLPPTAAIGIESRRYGPSLLQRNAGKSFRKCLKSRWNLQQKTLINTKFTSCNYGSKRLLIPTSF